MLHKFVWMRIMNGNAIVTVSGLVLVITCFESCSFHVHVLVVDSAS